MLVGGTIRFIPIFPAFRSLWLLQLICSELGLLLAIPLFLIAVFEIWGEAKDKLLGAAASMALALTLLPIGELVAQQRNWIWDLRYSHQLKPAPEVNTPNPYTLEIAEPLFRFSDFFRIPETVTPTIEAFETNDGGKLDIFIYRPTGEKARITPQKPWILSIHGGGWNSGKPDDLDAIYSAFLKAGYTVIAPAYRFAPTHVWPKQLEDVETSYEWIKKHADRLSLDKSKFWLMGRSAGGQIALKLGYNFKLHAEDPKAIRPLGIINLYAPTDLDFGYRWAFPQDVLNSRELMKAVTAATPDSDAAVYASASPLNDVTRDSPPTLSIYGKADPLVWYRHGIRLHERLRLNGVRSTLIELPWGTHGFDLFPNSPGGQITANAILHFLKETKN